MNTQEARTLADLWASHIEPRVNHQTFKVMRYALEEYLPEPTMQVALPELDGALAVVEGGVFRLRLTTGERDGLPADLTLHCDWLPTTDDGRRVGLVLRPQGYPHGQLSFKTDWTFEIAGETLELSAQRWIDDPALESDEAICWELASRAGWSKPPTPVEAEEETAPA